MAGRRLCFSTLHEGCSCYCIWVSFPFWAWLVMGSLFPCTCLLCFLCSIKGSLFPVMVHVLFCWFPACITSLSCSFFIYTLLTFDQKKKSSRELSVGPARERNKRETLSFHRSYFLPCSWLSTAPDTKAVSCNPFLSTRFLSFPPVT